KNAEANGVPNARAYVSDALTEVQPGLDACVTNPPIRAGKQVVYGFFAQAHDKLRPGGALYVVIRKQQGAPSAIRYLSTLFAEVATLEKDAGYWILRAVKAL
ncbi:MAG: methyltransferase, partial [Candidatus Spyradocola sp.]